MIWRGGEFLLAKASTKDQDQLVLEALTKAFQHDSEIRLITSGKNAGLFKDKKAAGRKAAIEKCIVGDAPLLHVERRAEQRRQVEYVRITPKGVRFLLSRLPVAQAAEIGHKH